MKGGDVPSGFEGVYRRVVLLIHANQTREEIMRKVITAMCIGIIVLGLVSPAWAAKATKEECITKCQEAAQLIKENGIDEGVKVIGDKKGPFVWKDTYVFLMNMDGEMLAHPIKPQLTKKGPLVESPDAAGRFFFAEFIKVADNPGTGWVDYMWPKPGMDKPAPKSSYICRVPGTPYFVGAGIYK